MAWRKVESIIGASKEALNRETKLDRDDFKRAELKAGFCTPVGITIQNPDNEGEVGWPVSHDGGIGFLAFPSMIRKGCEDGQVEIEKAFTVQDDGTYLPNWKVLKISKPANTNLIKVALAV